MSQIGQIIYNVEDYIGHGGLISSNAINPFTNGYVMEDSSGEIVNVLNNEKANKIDIYSNILEQCKIKNIKKLGIQAPPGTKFLISSPQEDLSKNGVYLIVGRTGIYELDLSGQGANILSYLSFLRPQNYVLDETESFTRAQSGVTKMNESKKKFDTSVNEIYQLYGGAAADTEVGKTYWKEYDRLYQDFCIEYEEARAIYLQGVNGVYRKGSEGDLQNIIIDFYYEPTESNTI